MALVGNSDEERVYRFLVAEIGNKYGAAGLAANIKAESNFKANNLQNSYNKKFGMTDEDYTAKVDNGEYTRDQFINDKAGYGLAQNTYWSIKQYLYEFWQGYGGSIGDTEMQLKCLCQQLRCGYKAVWDGLVNATSIDDASNLVLLKFERPADQSKTVQDKRAGYGHDIYNKYESGDTMNNGDLFLATMVGWIGFSEANGLFKQIIDLYNSKKPLPRGYAVKYTDEWCDTTVSAAGIKAGCDDLIGRECGCEEHIKIFKQLGIWEEDGTITPNPKDIILYNWDQKVQPNDGRADHIGVVESVSNGQITVVEGNKGEMVARRVLSVGNGYIRGYARPKWSGAVQTPVESTPTQTTGGTNKTIAYYGTVNTSTLNVRTWAGTENPNLTSYPTIKQGTKVGICDVVKDKDGDPWYYVVISGDKGDKYGFVSAQYITKLETSQPNTNTGGALNKNPQWVGKITASTLNVRTWAGTNNPNIKSYPKLAAGNLVDVCDTVIADDGSRWYYVRIGGKTYGFVHSAYVVQA
ncbi:MAG: phage tail tip lysozyme [Ruminococcus flavefaciens]|nr:phage tail tip lysozyme [Ruminococcus flavefaciens]